MIQRNLLRHSRTTCLSSRCISARQPARPYIPQTRISPLQKPTFQRYYSANTETPNDAGPEASVKDASASEAQADEPLREDIEAKNKEIIDLKDKYLRSVADFRNLQDRTRRDIETARSFAISRFASDLIESVDNLDRALGTVAPESVAQAEKNKELVNLYEGLKMTNTILMQTLKKHGLERFDPSEKGEMFNPNLHEATFQTKVEGKEDGSVFMTQQKGFSLNGRVVRAAKVGVVKNS